MATNRPRKLIVIGSSAGGLSALSRILEALPADLPAAIIIVRHLSPDYESKLAEILDQRTCLHVEQARLGTKLRAGNVYVAPPAHHLTVDRFRRLRLNSQPPVHFSRPAVDPLFISAAEVFHNEVVGVILSGYGKDGTDGVRAVHEQGGIVIVQNEESSEKFDMPAAAIATGCVDHILPLAEIGPQLVRLTQ